MLQQKLKQGSARRSIIAATLFVSIVVCTVIGVNQNVYAATHSTSYGWSVLDEEQIYGDVSGIIFGKTKYMKNGVVCNYTSGGYEFIFYVNAEDGGNVVSYIEIGGVSFPVTWYSDQECTSSIGVLADDGVTYTISQAAYGRAVLDPTLFVKTKTVRFATATLFIEQYLGLGLTDKVGSETYKMDCTIDVSGPSISAMYNPSTNKISAYAADTISGLNGSISYSITGGPSGTLSDDITYPTDASDTSDFIITFTAYDVLGNRGEEVFTFSPEGERPGNVTVEDGVSVYSYKTRYFKVYILNGVLSDD